MWVSHNMNVILNSLKIVLFAPKPSLGRSGNELDHFAQVRMRDALRKFQKFGFSFDSDAKELSLLSGTQFPHL